MYGILEPKQETCASVLILHQPDLMFPALGVPSLLHGSSWRLQGAFPTTGPWPGSLGTVFFQTPWTGVIERPQDPYQGWGQVSCCLEKINTEVSPVRATGTVPPLTAWLLGGLGSAGGSSAPNRLVLGTSLADTP